MNKLNNSKIKQSVCIIKDHGKDIKTMRYVVENTSDLNKFLIAFPKMNMKLFTEPMKRMIKEKSVILLTDENKMSGFNTYCNEHPQGLIREKL